MTGYLMGKTMKFFKTLFVVLTTTFFTITLQSADLNIATLDPQAALYSTNVAKKELEELENSDEWKEVVEELQAKATEAREIQERTQKDGPTMSLTRKDLYLALAAEVPIGVMDGVTGANPYKTWNEVRSDLPNIPIVVYGPPPTSGTRDAFAEIALSGGCNEIPWIKKLKKKDKKAWKKLCRTVREDGPYVEAGENDNLIIQKLNANKDSFGIFGFSFLDQNKDKVKGAVIDGVEPTFDAIASGDYKVSRSLYFYVKKDHVGVIPGVQEYMEFFMSDDAVGEDGYLLDKGLIPLPASTRTKFQSDAKTLANLVR